MKKNFSSYWVRSAFYSILQRFSLTLFGLINFMVLIRGLSKAEMGTWALFLTIISIFEAAKGGLLKNAHIRFVSASNDSREKVTIASSSLMINALISLVFILFLLFFSGWMSLQLHAGTNLAIMLKWFIPGLVCMVFFSHLEAIQQSHLDFKGVFAGYLVRQFTFFLIIVAHAFVNFPFSVGYLALYQALSIFLGTLTLYIFSIKYLFHSFNISAAWIRKIIGYGGYIFGSGVMANVYASVDQIMTATFMSSSSVAYYNTASRLNGLVDIPSYAAAEILFPKSSRAAAEEGSDKVKYLYERMVGILLSFTTPAAIFIILFPKFIITLIAGSQYEAAAPILQLYMITGLLRPMQNQAANLLNSIGKPALCFVVNTIFLAIYLLINFICLSNFGFYGAAIGTLISCIIGSITWYFIMKNEIGLQLTKVLKFSAGFYKEAYLYLMKSISKKKERAVSKIHILKAQHSNLPKTSIKIAHLILAHKNPLQTERLIRTLDHPAFDFYIHVDEKTDVNPFLFLANRQNVFFIKNRTKIYWAGYGTIQATINGFEEILPLKYDYINVISAQDFPIKSADFIYEYLLSRQGKEFITCESIEDEWKEAAVRVKKYHFINWRIPGKHRLEKLANQILQKRKFPLDYTIVGRANWFTLTHNAAQYILDFLNAHPEVVKYFKYCWGADEFIFATIIYNSHFKEKIEDNLVYVDWSEKKAHPKILTSEDFSALINSNKLFARKFDMDADSIIFNMLEEFIAAKKRVSFVN